MTNPLPVGRSAWNCVSNPVIFPGWWNSQNPGGIVGGLNTIDGARTMAPDVVIVGETIRLYYLAERVINGISSLTILQARATLTNPTNFTRRGIALEFPASQKHAPSPGDDPEAYYAAGPFHTTVLPWLTPDGSAPAKDANGDFRPWWMYLGSYGNNPAVARSMDGGETFQLVPDKNPLFPFECITVNGVPRRTPVMHKSKPYDFGGCGSPSVIRKNTGEFIMFYTAQAFGFMLYDDLGALPAEIGAGHENGKITDIGIGYAESLDGVTFTRRTSLALGVTSPAARGSGRIIDPRRRDNPNGLMEYIVSRPIVFRDGDVWRMTVSSHSTSYRPRSLHSDDLINWFWDPSPAEGFLGLGAPGTFDSLSAAYPRIHRIGDAYHCWYTGNQYGHHSAGPNNPATGQFSTGIGYATAAVL